MRWIGNADICPMDLDRLRSFLRIAETGSFSLAAVALNVTQSTISGRIGALEAELGQMLFHRRRVGVELTAAGLALQPHARRIVQTWEQARQQVALPPGFHTSFRLGGPVALWDGVITHWVSWMRAHAKGVALHLEGSYSDILFDQLSRPNRAGRHGPPRARADLVPHGTIRALLADARSSLYEGSVVNGFLRWRLLFSFIVSQRIGSGARGIAYDLEALSAPSPAGGRRPG